MTKSLIKSINWVITNKCNSKCAHCDIWQTKDKNELRTENIKKILDNEIIKKSYEKYKGQFDISLGGGEPFLRKDFQEIVNTVKTKYSGSLKTISTNGLLTKKILRFIRQNKDMDFKLNVSVDGIGKVHDRIRGINGAFKKTINTIMLVKRLFPSQKIELKLTLTPQNYDQILKVYKLSLKLGCDFSFKPAENMANYTNKAKEIPLNFTREQLCIIRNQAFKLADIAHKKGNYRNSRFFKDIAFYLANKKKPKSCSVLTDHITIMPNGDYFFCIKEKKAGNLPDKSINFSKDNKSTACKSCMLMCGSYKGYSNDFFEKKVANIETTLNCNLNCGMCTQKELRKTPSEDMNIKTFGELIKNNSITHVSFVGGEPFLNKDFFEMMDYLDRKAITYEITTNGTLINQDSVEKLKDCIGLKKMNFSLDGLKHYHDKERGQGIFDKCINALKATKGLVEANVCTVMKKDNLNEIPKLTKFLAELGIKNQKLIYGMDLSDKARELSQKKIANLEIQGPRFSNSLRSYREATKLFSSLDKCSKNNLVNISYEPAAIKSKPKSFLGGELSAVSCKQLNQLRFNNGGERIVCEFIRNKHPLDISNKLSDKLLPICKHCCKLDLTRDATTSQISLMIEPTNRCNLRCPTCFSHQDGRKKRDMSFEDFKKVIDENIDVIGNISLYNYGEPLLNKNIFSMIKYAKGKAIKYIKLATNGMELNKENIISLLNSKLDYLSTSLDGATKETYSKFRVRGRFDSILENIKNLVRERNKIKSNMKIELQFIIMEHNKHEIKAIENLSRNLGVDTLRLKKVLIKHKKWKYLLPTDLDYNRYRNLVEDSSCSKPRKELVINSDGTVIPCCYVVGKDIAKFNLGNIFDKPLKEIMHSGKYNQFVGNCRTRKEKNSCCIACNEGNLDLNYKVIDLNAK